MKESSKFYQKTDYHFVTWKKISVFVSSTFSDMMAERDYLMTEVFPEIASKLSENKIYLHPIDLRWGITEEDSVNNKRTVEICLRNIKDTHPVFLCLLGQRRGWIPDTSDINRDTLLDFNVSVLNDYLANKLSITEMETLQALDHKVLEDVSKKALFFQRKSEFLEELPRKMRKTFLGEKNDKPENWKIREHVKKHYPIYEYSAKWVRDKDGGHFDAHQFMVGEETLGDRIFSEILSIAKDMYPENFIDSKGYGELAQFVKACEQREDIVENPPSTIVSRKTYQNAIDHFMQKSENKAFLLYSQNGSGKTSLLIEWISNNYKNYNVIGWFIGNSSLISSENVIRGLLFDLCEKDDFLSLPSDKYALIQLLAQKLTKIKNPILILDEVNLMEEDAFFYRFLINAIPAKMILTMSTDTENDRTVLDDIISWGVETLYVSPFLNRNEIRSICEMFLLTHLKKLDERIYQKHLLPNKISPLYLNIALNELLCVSSYDKIDEALVLIGDSVETAFNRLMYRTLDEETEKNKQELTLKRCFASMIALSKHGLPESIIISASKFLFSSISERNIQKELRRFLYEWSHVLYRSTTSILFRSETLSKYCLASLSEESQKLLHNALFLAFAAVADPFKNSTWSGTDADAFNNVSYHMYKFDENALFNLISNAYYVLSKIKCSGIENILKDFDLCLLHGDLNFKNKRELQGALRCTQRWGRFREGLKLGTDELELLRRVLLNSIKRNNHIESEKQTISNIYASLRAVIDNIYWKEGKSTANNHQHRSITDILLRGQNGYSLLCEFLGNLWLYCNSEFPTFDEGAYFLMQNAEAFLPLPHDYNNSPYAVSVIYDTVYYIDNNKILTGIRGDRIKKYPLCANPIALCNRGDNLLISCDNGKVYCLFFDDITEFGDFGIGFDRIMQFRDTYVFIQKQRKVAILNDHMQYLCMDLEGHDIVNVDHNCMHWLVFNDSNGIFSIFDLESMSIIAQFAPFGTDGIIDTAFWWTLFNGELKLYKDHQTLTLILDKGSNFTKPFVGDQQVMLVGEKLLYTKKDELWVEGGTRLDGITAPIKTVGEYKGQKWFLDSNNTIVFLPRFNQFGSNNQ